MKDKKAVGTIFKALCYGVGLNLRSPSCESVALTTKLRLQYTTNHYLHVAIWFRFRAYMRITAVLQLCTAVSCHILRLKCKKEAGFDIQYTGKKLPGPHLAIYRGINVRECYAYCIHEERCKSVNINDASVGTMCELMEKSASDSKDDVVPVSAIGWQSHTTNFSSRLVSNHQGASCVRFHSVHTPYLILVCSQ